MISIPEYTLADTAKRVAIERLIDETIAELVSLREMLRHFDNESLAMADIAAFDNDNDIDFDETRVPRFEDLMTPRVVLPHWYMPPIGPALSDEELERRAYDNSREAGEHEAVAAAATHLPGANGWRDITLLQWLPAPGGDVIAIFGADDFGSREVYLANRNGAVGFPVDDADELYEFIGCAISMRRRDSNMPAFQRPSMPFISDMQARQLLTRLFDMDCLPRRDHRWHADDSMTGALHIT